MTSTTAFHPDISADGTASSGLPDRLPSPVRRFIGRQTELDNLLRALIRQEGPAVFHLTGPEGCGKTTLAAEAARRLYADNRFKQVVYTDFAGGGALDAAAWELASAFGVTDEVHDGRQLQSIREHLSSQPVLVIWNHLEALLPEGDAPVPDRFLRELLQAGAELFTSTPSRLLVIAEKILPVFAQQNGVLVLPELTPLNDADARELLDAVSPPELSPETFEYVLSLSQNRPLAIQALAALLHHFTVENLETLRAQAFSSALNGPWLGQQVHDFVLGIVWQVLSAPAREALYGLAVFNAGGMERLVSQLNGVDAESWRRFRTLTQQAGLVIPEQVAPLAIPYMRFHPVLQHYALRHLTRENQARLLSWYCGSYLALQRWISEQEQRTGKAFIELRWRELPNFRRGFSLLLGSQQLSLIQDYAQVLGKTLEQFGLQQEIEQINELMKALLQSALPKEGPLPRAGVTFMLEQMRKMLDSGKGQQAMSILQPMCQRIERDDQLAYQGDEARIDRARAYHVLARAALATNQPPMALASLLRALTFYDQLSDQAALHEEILELLCELVDMLLSARQLGQAEKMAERALLLAATADDKAALAKLNYQLALISAKPDAQERSQRFAERSLEYYQALDDAEGLAEVYRHLANLSMQRVEPARATEQLLLALREAKRAAVEPLEGDILSRLGVISAQENNPGQAEVYLMQALMLFEKHHIKPAQAATEVQLAELLLRQGQLANARIHAEAARALIEAAGPSAQPWSIFDLLERIAVAENQPERAAFWRRRTRESFAESPMAEPVMLRWRPLLRKLAAACNGEALGEDTLETMEKMEAEINNPELFSTIWRVLGGERGSTLYESLGLGEAVVIKRLLDGIEHPELLADPPASAQTKQPLPEAGFSVPQFIAAVKAALQGDQKAQAATDEFIRMLDNEQAPQTLRDFAASIKRVLAGERDTSLADGLPDELANVIHALIKALTPSEAAG